MTSLESNFSNLSNFFQPQNSNFFSSQSLINKKNTSQISSLIGSQSSSQKKEQKLHDIDLILVNLRTGFTLKDLRNEKSLEFRKKYKEKIEKEKIKNQIKNIRKKELYISRNKKIGERKINTKNISFYGFKKSNSLYKTINKVLPLLKNKENKKYNSEYELVLSYENPLLKKSPSTSEINPLFYDNFNRSYNTSQYFNINFDENNFEEKSLDSKKDNLEYTLKFKSNIQLIKKPNKFIKNDIMTQRLRNIYKGKFEKIFYDKNKKNNLIKINCYK